MRFYFIFVFLTYYCCNTSQPNSTYVPDIVLKDNFKIVETVFGKVTSIDSTQRNYQISIEDTISNNNRKYLILSVRQNQISNNKIEVGKDYMFKVIKLTNIHPSSGTIEIDGKYIEIAPNLAIQQCINYNNETFCIDEPHQEIYEQSNLFGLEIFSSKSNGK